MASSSGLSPAKVILLAVQFAASTNISTLRQLTALHPTVLNLVLSLRILLSFLPESTEPALYTPYIQDLVRKTFNKLDGANVDISAVEKLTDLEAHRRVRKLGLLPLEYTQASHQPSEDALTLFLIHRAHKIDAETGLLPLLPQLLEPFLDHSEYIRTWTISTLLPLLRLNYEYYPRDEPKFSLEVFERLGDNVGASLLLSKVGHRRRERELADETVGRDLRGVVGPWMYGNNRGKRRKLVDKRRRTSVVARLEEVRSNEETIQQHDAKGSYDWQQVYEWLVNEAVGDFFVVVHAVEHWDGPGDVDYGDYDDGQQHLDEATQQSLKTQYAQTAIAAIYATNDNSPKAFKGAYCILDRVAELMDLPRPWELDSAAGLLPEINLPSNIIDKVSDSHLVRNALLLPSNPLTKANQQSLTLLSALLLSTSMLRNLGALFSVKRVAELYLSGDEEVQKVELRKAIRNLGSGTKKDDKEWTTLRSSLLWLWGWGSEPHSQSSTDSSHKRQGAGVFGKVEEVFLETEVLRAFLSGTRYQLVIDTYITLPASNRLLALDQVEKLILDTAMTFYDNASNGNKNRGGVKRASDIINAFRDYFPQSFSLRHTHALLNATHSLSFYSLTLQHGVPFQPVNIRVHQDPVSLIGKVLEQNPRSYTKLDDLLDIGRNLVAAGLTNPLQEGGTLAIALEDQEQRTVTAERRIMGMAIEAALAEDDFDTAYSYVLNRLAPPSHAAKQSTSGRTLTQQDDTSWRAAYQAGRYRPDKSPEPPNTEVRSLEQRMELLSQALLLAPQTALSEVLAVWRRCEEELNVLLAQESEEDERWDDRGDHKVPGGFSNPSSPTLERGRTSTRGANYEEAPIGLFDVARGAAAALSKSALRNASGFYKNPGDSMATTEHQRTVSGVSIGDSDASSIAGSDGEGRVRKRDMVSNMVTGGLASGISWVLGAPPQQQG
ncbi:MAG: hypothetical protein M1830_008281 [Pleopsidium flavum]|nr:MAG: hypothetical protein M1830_008281 [Pleopsidium flavum]